MITIGLPAGLQGCMFSLSNVIIQSTVNGYATTTIAGNAIAGNIEGFVYTSMNSVYHTALTFVGQNVGAGKYRRIKRIAALCAGMVFCIGLVMGGTLALFGDKFMLLYAAEQNRDAVIAAGMNRMHIVAAFYFLCGLMDVMVGQLRGIGYSIMPMIVSLTGACLLRIVWIMTVFAQNHTLTVLYMSYPVSWFVTFAIHFFCYMLVARKRLDQLKAVPAQG